MLDYNEKEDLVGFANANRYDAKCFAQYRSLLMGSECLYANLQEDGEWLDLRLQKNGVQFNLIYHAIGECCSYSWIESVNDINDFEGAVINDIDLVSGDSEWNQGHDYLQWDFYNFRTSKGTITV